MRVHVLYLCWLAMGAEAWQSAWPSTARSLQLGSLSRLGPRLGADRFGAPGLAGQQPTILNVARPLMDAAKALERAGTTVVSFAGDERPIFDGGPSDILQPLRNDNITSEQYQPVYIRRCSIATPTPNQRSALRPTS